MTWANSYRSGVVIDFEMWFEANVLDWFRFLEVRRLSHVILVEFR